MLSPELVQELSTHIGHGPYRTEPVAGGCIHTALKLSAASGTWFLKVNDRRERTNFEAEAHGLALLRSADALQTPRVIATGEAGGQAFLLLEFIPSQAPQPDFWTGFGQGLARLHRFQAQTYGLDRDNFIGRLPQRNTPAASWTDFFVQERLLPQLRLALDRGDADASLARDLDRLFPRLDRLVPPEPASLLHGDLWSGNFLCGTAQQAVVLDPAVYYGHREAELAFTCLFGGFRPSFYAAYEAAYPLEAGWRTRIDLFNLYPLMVHLNLFGPSYLPEIQRSLKKYG